jgi:UDP-3-O-[3-hydroxymyristoyl] glucosamine N-acyltransferase
MIGGMVGIAGHLSVCDDVVVTGLTLVSHSIRKPGVYSGGLPLDEARRWRRNAVRFRHLDDLAKRVESLSGRKMPSGEEDDGGGND